MRTTETKTCSDCHLSANDDNNAIMSQLLLLGTNFVNFTTADPLQLTSVTLYNTSDGGAENGFRSTSGFNLLADGIREISLRD